MTKNLKENLRPPEQNELKIGRRLCIEKLTDLEQRGLKYKGRVNGGRVLVYSLDEEIHHISETVPGERYKIIPNTP